MQIGPATSDDVSRGAATFPDLIEDRWREGGNRRSFVAVDASDWMAIVSVPVPGGPRPEAFPRERVPAQAAWVEELLPHR